MYSTTLESESKVIRDKFYEVKGSGNSSKLGDLTGTEPPPNSTAGYEVTNPSEIQGAS